MSKTAEDFANDLKNFGVITINTTSNQIVFAVIQNMGYEGDDLIGIYSSKEKANAAAYKFLLDCYGSQINQWIKSTDTNGTDTYKKGYYESIFVLEQHVQ